MKRIILIISTILVSSSAIADYALSTNGKTVKCHAEDNMSWVLNAKRTTIKFTVEGESAGPRKIIKIIDNGHSSISYITSEGIFTLSERGDTFLFDGDSIAGEIDCK